MLFSRATCICAFSETGIALSTARSWQQLGRKEKGRCRSPEDRSHRRTGRIVNLVWCPRAGPVGQGEAEHPKEGPLGLADVEALGLFTKGIRGCGGQHHKSLFCTLHQVSLLLQMHGKKLTVFHVVVLRGGGEWVGEEGTRI